MESTQEQIDNIINAMGLGNLSQEEKDKLIANMAETLQNKVFVAVMDDLNEEQKAELNNLSESGDDEQISNYLKENVPLLEGIIAVQAEQYKNELLEASKGIDELLKKTSEQQQDQPEQSQDNQ